jgi:hypothetical protein
MAKLIERRSGTKDDPGYYPGLIIGLRVSRGSTKGGKPESKPGKAQSKKSRK